MEKTCPICGKKVKQAEEGVTVCPKCGHSFRPSD
jgi:ribosomal protein L37AE/L43A